MRHFKDWLKAYMKFCKYSESPDIFHFWTGVSTVAGALRARVWINMGYFSWYPNFYIVLVAPPGIVSKSTTISIGMSLLKEVEGIHFGPDVVTWQSLVESLGNAAQLVEIPGEEDRVMSPITIAASELGTFLNTQDREMIDILTDLWDCREGLWEKHTKTSGKDKVNSPWLNIIACTTPSWINTNFPESMIHGGFASRIIFAYAEKKRRLIAYPSLEMDQDMKEMRRMLIEDLTTISQIAGQYQLTPEAIDYGNAWYEENARLLEKLDKESRQAGYFSRKQSHLHKLAMILAASQSNELIIDKPHLQAASTILKAIEPSMHKVFEQVNSENAKYTRRLLNFLESLEKPIPLRECFAALMSEMGLNEFKMAVEGAKQAGKISANKINGELYIALQNNGERS